MKDFFFKIPEIIREKEILAKGICFFLAIAAYMYVINTKTGTISFEIPIEIKKLPDDLVIAKMPKKTVSVKLHGNKDYLKNVKDITAFINLQKATRGKKKYLIHIKKKHIPEKVSIKLSHKYANIVIEKKSYQKIRIIPKFTGDIPISHKMGNHVVKPEYVYISGPNSVVKKIKYLYTESIQLKKQKNYFEKDIEINNSAYPSISISESNVRVYVPIYSKKDLLAIKIPIVIINKNNEYNYEIITKNSVVYVKSTDDTVLSPDKTERIVKAINVSADISILSPKIFNNKKKIVETFIPLSMNYQNNIEKLEIISIEPKSIKIKISKK